MILLDGISDSGGPDSVVDGEFFKKLCYTSVTSIGGKVLSIHEPDVAQNFYCAEIRFPNEENLFILLNGIYPFLAFATTPEAFRMTFVDHEQLATTISAHYGNTFRVLRKKELDEPLRFKEKKGGVVVLNANNLNKWDMYNIKYWQPKTVGEVVFNYWD